MISNIFTLFGRKIKESHFSDKASPGKGVGRVFLPILICNDDSST